MGPLNGELITAGLGGRGAAPERRKEIEARSLGVLAELQTGMIEQIISRVFGTDALVVLVDAAIPDLSPNIHAPIPCSGRWNI